jgi:twitching motility protein PilJ
MSVAQQISRLFKRGQPSAEPSILSQVGFTAEEAYAMEQTSNAGAGRAIDGNNLLGEASALTDTGSMVSLPLLGTREPAAHRRILTVMLIVALMVFLAVMFFALAQADNVARQVGASGQSLMQSQRLAKSVSQALVGSPQAFTEVSDSSAALVKNVRGLKDGNAELNLTQVAPAILEEVDKALPLVDRAEKNAATVLGQQKILTQVGSALRTINRQSSDLLEVAETVSSLKLQQNAPAAEISASGQLVMLTQRIGKSANEFLTMEGVSPEAVFLLGKDLNSFKEIAQGLLDGSPELRLAAAKDPQTRERLEALLKQYEETRGQAGVKRNRPSCRILSRCAVNSKIYRAVCLVKRVWVLCR